MTAQGTQYAAFIEAELRAENDRRASVNTRAAAALTGSAGLVTVVLAVFVVLIGPDFTLTGWSKAWLVTALIALLAAAVCALVAGLPWRYKATSPETLRHFLQGSWGDSEPDARNRTAYCNAVVVESLRRGNCIKSACLIGAAVCQLVAVMALAFCTIVVIA